MRRFYSYGPVNSKKHFSVQRRSLIETCLDHIVDDPDEGGHYFTIWAPRQTGKTWIMRQVKHAIQSKYGDRFIIGTMSMQSTILDESNPDDILQWIPLLIRDTFNMNISPVNDWKGWINLFHRSILDYLTVQYFYLSMNLTSFHHKLLIS